MANLYSKEDSAFFKIDDIIKAFVEGTEINVSCYTKSDWLVFQTRSLYWNKDNVRKNIEIFPGFNEAGEIVGLNVTGSATYDENGKRYFLSQKFCDAQDVDIVVNSIKATIEKSYKWLESLSEADIPLE